MLFLCVGLNEKKKYNSNFKTYNTFSNIVLEPFHSKPTNNIMEPQCRNGVNTHSKFEYHEKIFIFKLLYYYNTSTFVF